MAITLAKLCSDAERKYNMKLVAGKDGINNTVRWVHMVEDSQVPEFIHGDELIFTTGIGRIATGKLMEFIKNLKEHGAVGVVVNIGPYIKEIPKEAADYCEREKFPLFALPWNIYIIDITYDFCRRIIENEKSEMSVVDAFKNLIFHPDAADGYISTLELSGFKVMNCYTLMVINFMRDNKNFTEQLYEKKYMKLWSVLARSKYPSAMFLTDGMIVVIRQNCSDVVYEQIFERLEQLLEPTGISYAIGISDTKRGYKSVPELLHQANAAYSTAQFKRKKMIYYRDIGINKLLFGIENKKILSDYVREHLDRFYSYDSKNNSDYAEILKQYLENDSSIKNVAESNGVHRNTVNGRIKQIKEIFNLELDSRTKTEIMLAYHIKDMIDYIGRK